MTLQANWTVVKDINTSASVLAEIAEAETTTNIDFWLAMAQHPNTPSEVLAHLAYDESSEIRSLVAKHRNTSIESFQKLSTDDNEYVLISLAENSSIPLEILEILAESDYSNVRESVAGNPNASNDILINLINDEECHAYEYIKNPSKELVVLAKILKYC